MKQHSGCTRGFALLYINVFPEPSTYTVSIFPFSSSAMADNILHELNARNLFDLRGVVAVVTGGGTVGSSDF